MAEKGERKKAGDNQRSSRGTTTSISSLGLTRDESSLLDSPRLAFSYFPLKVRVRAGQEGAPSSGPFYRLIKTRVVAERSMLTTLQRDPYAYRP